VFLRTPERAATVAFYRERLGFERWLEQSGCTILEHENLLLGFCDGEEADTDGIVTLFYPDRGRVEARYDDLADIATSEPTYNEEYDIYQFFAEDPEGRTLEIQTFEHELPK
jgi:catechol 2,3-dioxygenase-like lactoylglutathione lyase family enzyme